jgi:hypothetical protein
MPCAVRLPPEAVLVTPKSKLVSAVGMSSDATQQKATTAAVARLWPRWPARSFSQTDAQTAPRTRPGSTNGTSRRLAHGWSGETAGRYSTVTITQTAISSGSAHTRAASPGSRQVVKARTPRRANTARPNAPSSTAGAPRYQTTQYKLFW